MTYWTEKEVTDLKECVRISKTITIGCQRFCDINPKRSFAGAMFKYSNLRKSKLKVSIQKPIITTTGKKLMDQVLHSSIEKVKKIEILKDSLIVHF